jgi:hypothetical protein
MPNLKRRVAALYVDRNTQQWVVRDNEGNLWSVPPGENGWDQRSRFEPSEESDLEILPGHYIFMIDFNG